MEPVVSTVTGVVFLILSGPRQDERVVMKPLAEFGAGLGASALLLHPCVVIRQGAQRSCWTGPSSSRRATLGSPRPCET